MELKYKIAKMIASDIELGLLEGTGCTFEDDNEWPESKQNRDFYLRLAEKVIKEIKS
jgi:hypothetical protein